MRHDVRVQRAGYALRAQALTHAPASRALGVRHAPAAAALVALCRLTLRTLTCRARAGSAAVALTTVAVAAQQHLRPAASAHEQAGRMLGQGHAPRGETPRALRARNAHGADAVQCWTDSPGNATLTPHPLHQHGAGHGAVLKLPSVQRPPPCPPTQGLTTLLPRPARACHPRAEPARPAGLPVESFSYASRPRHRLGRQADLACLAALQGSQAGESTRNSCSSKIRCHTALPITESPPHIQISAVPDRRSHHEAYSTSRGPNRYFGTVE